MIYNLLIVDDEQEIVEWLYELFTEQNDVELQVYKANSSKEAVRWLEKVKIDVVLSDIRMPGMTGLQLLEKIKKEWPKCRVIFLTGFREFDYVYTAIQNQVISYLLKTEEDEKIVQAVNLAIQDIEEELQDKKIVGKAMAQMNKALPLLQKEYLHEILEGYIKEENISQKRFEEYDIPIIIENRVFMIIGYLDDLPAKMALPEKNQFLYSLKSISEQLLPEQCRYICIDIGQSNLLWIVQPIFDELTDGMEQDPKDYEKFAITLEGTLEYIQRACKKSLNTTVSFGFLNKPSYLAETSYLDMKRLLRYRIGLENEIVLTAADLLDNRSAELKKEDTDLHDAVKQLHRIKELESYIESGRKEECFLLLNNLLEPLKKISSKSNNVALELYFNVAVIYLGYINRWKLNDKIAKRIDLQYIMQTDSFNSWDEAVHFLYDVAEELFNLRTEDEKSRAADTITRLKQYIRENLGDDLSLIKLADSVYLNPSYLSRLFKQATGKNVSEYILGMRIDQAREMLRQNTKKINEISEEVGYRSSHSFTRFFKNTVGISPQEYRDSYLNK